MYNCESGICFQTFYPLVARAELHEDAMPIEFMQDRKLDFVDYSKLKPFTVSTTNCTVSDEPFNKFDYYA